jgi:hypothetical protein
MAEWVDDFGNKLTNVHESIDCATHGVCSIHSPSNHSMSSYPQKWRADRSFMERICVHGIGHPDPDGPSAAYSSIAIHGCDGCCTNEVP